MDDSYKIWRLACILLFVGLIYYVIKYTDLQKKECSKEILPPFSVRSDSGIVTLQAGNVLNSLWRQGDTPSPGLNTILLPHAVDVISEIPSSKLYKDYVFYFIIYNEGTTTVYLYTDGNDIIDTVSISSLDYVLYEVKLTDIRPGHEKITYTDLGDN